MDLFSRACVAFEFTMSLEKIEIMFSQSQGQRCVEPNIFVQGTGLDVVDSFIFLGSTLSRDRFFDSEINPRIEKVSKAFQRFENRLGSDRGVTFKIKLSIYESCILTALLYSSGTWTTYWCHIKDLEKFHQTFLRRIPDIKRKSLTSDTLVLQQTNTTSIELILIHNQMLGWVPC